MQFHEYWMCYITLLFFFVNLAANLLLNWICPFLVFLERLQLITAAAFCIIAINALAPRAFNPESQYFIPLFNKISWRCGQQPEGMKHQMRGATQAQQGMSLHITLLYMFTTNDLSLKEPQKKNIFSIELGILILKCKTHV